MGLRLLFCAVMCFLVAGCATAKKGSAVSQEESLNMSNAQGNLDESLPTETESNGFSVEPKGNDINAVNSFKSAALLTKHDIQTALKNAGFYNGPVDGKLGSQTRKAIKDFQKANGLEADGIAGKKTKALLVKYLEK
ncbi:MAG: peptidoglycan-binding domain-containing protein [Candidatus Omnitrophica bacterium]|nr:peptidoglycan-binding domain-containing protein [Candidatus Omnitrophota bacterium]